MGGGAKGIPRLGDFDLWPWTVHFRRHYSSRAACKEPLGCCDGIFRAASRASICARWPSYIEFFVESGAQRSGGTGDSERGRQDDSQTQGEGPCGDQSREVG